MTTKREIEIKVLCSHEQLLPHYSSLEAAGADLKANLSQDVLLQPGERRLIPTGLRLEIPFGYELQIRPRSGLALKHGITVLNTPGTIDSDYRGEVGVILMNHGQEPFTVTPGMRIAQAVLSPVVYARYTLETNCLQESARGSGGFGHTGC